MKEELELKILQEQEKQQKIKNAIAATKISSFFRSYVARKKFYKLRMDYMKNNAAIKIQSFARQCFAKQIVTKIKVEIEAEKQRLLKEQQEKEAQEQAAAEAKALALKLKKEEDERLAKLKVAEEEAERLRLAKIAEEEKAAEEERIKAAEELLQALAEEEEEEEEEEADKNDIAVEETSISNGNDDEDDHDKINETGNSEEDITEFLKSNGISMDGTEQIDMEVEESDISGNSNNDENDNKKSGSNSSAKRLESIRNKLNKIKTQEVSTPVLLGRNIEKHSTEKEIQYR